MSSNIGFRMSAAALAVLGAFGATGDGNAQPTVLANEPLSTGLSAVPPNIMFIIDDSGSMAREYTPDHVNDSYCRGGSTSGLSSCGLGDPLYSSPQFNAQYYNPNIRYRAPYHPDDVGKAEDDNSRVYPTYNNVGSNQKWNAVKEDPFASNGTRDLLTENIDRVACGESSPSETDKHSSSVCRELIDYSVRPAAEAVGTGTYLYPNPRFNASSSTTTVHFEHRVTRSGSGSRPIPPYFYTISKVEWCEKRNTSNPSTGRTQSKHRFGKGTSNTGAAAYATNPCLDRKGFIGGTNYRYPKFGLVAHNSNNDNANQNSHLNNTTVIGVSDFEGISGFRRWNIVDAGGNTLAAGYPANNFQGAGTKAPGRSDCAGAACTYSEEMTNYANWYAYYRSRLQAMKSAASRAFESLSTNYRVGYITINPGSTVLSSRYLKIDSFTGSHRNAWYSKLFATNTSGSTPLREALARVGWIYAGQLNTGLTSGIPAADDPVIASCQQNFAILTTDGFWNGSAGQQLDGSSIGDQDNDISTAPRPFYDGPNSSSQTATSTLSDVAFYYYVNDLRTGLTNDVPTTAKDTASHQHMTTFTLGLGIDGRLKYRSDYETANSGDYFDIRQGTLNWPKPQSDADTAVDDLWHAAVNGRGKYFSAQDPSALASGLEEALTEVGSRVGAGAAAATSSLRPSAGDQLAFTAQYETVKWHGDLKARTIDVDTASSTFGQVATRDLWSAQALLDAKDWTTRNILTYDSTDTVGDLLKKFCFDAAGAGCTGNGSGLTAGEKAFFNPTLLNHYTSFTTAQKDGANGGVTAEKIVNYLRGDRSNEGVGTALNQLFRVREHVLGDIVNSQPVYVKRPPFDYSDSHYATFKANNANRQAVVFSGANDGMLHAYQVDPDGNAYFQTGGFATVAEGDDTFSAGTNDGGGESWAYVPGIVMPRLTPLANSSAFTHQYFVDGSPVVADVCTTVPCASANDWRTILVSGLNGGGRGYFALDITNPVSPKALWEFSTLSTTPCRTDAEINTGAFSDDCHLGYTYGSPIITKWKNTLSGNDGRWVVFVTSGYNNYNPGDGRGYLYMLDAITGKILGRVTTGVGSGGTAGASYTDADPSGLGKINIWLDNGLVNNSGEHVYGGDLKGNLWRFNVGGAPATFSATKITVAKDAANNVQPITVRPELGFPKSKRVVFFGTGKYLGQPDTTDVTQQTIYGIKDDLSGTLVDSRGAGVVARSFAAEVTLPDGTVARSIASGGTALDFSSPTQFGFRIDLPTAGERVNVDLALQVGTLVVASNIPNTTGSCSAGGAGWENYINFETGESVQAVSSGGSTAGAKKFSSGLIVGTTIVQLPGGKTVAITTSADTKQTTSGITAGGGGGAGVSGRRSSWREIITE
ncbi:MAG: pilus assembly protein [Burkholderiales bacterium]